MKRLRLRRHAALVLLCVGLVVAVSCNDDGEGSTDDQPTEEDLPEEDAPDEGNGDAEAEWQEGMDESCTVAREGALAEPQATDAAGAAANAASIIVILGTQVTTIEALDPPDASTATAELMVTNLEQQIGLWEQAEQAANAGDQATYQSLGPQIDQLRTSFSQTASAAGLVVCATQFDPP